MNSRAKNFSLLAILLIAAGCSSSSSGGGNTTEPPPTEPPPTEPPPPPPLRSRVPNNEMGGGDGNDIWGWVDPMNDDEYAIMGLTNGTAFVDVTDPENPVFIGHLATNTVDSSWRDMKVYMDHAYIVADGAGAHGMQVFDLTRLRTAVPPENFMPDTVYTDFGNSHNIAINEATGFAYAVGTDTCDEGLHMVDITTPNSPMFAGCYDEQDIHDTQCVTYMGPDMDHAGSELCFNSASSNTANNLPIGTHNVGIVDVTNKAAPVTIFERDYPEAGFAHQGWLTDDHRFFLLGDEADETGLSVPTRTLVFDVSDLDAPVFVAAYEAATASIDHNLYIVGNRVYQANYTSGVRILEFGDLAMMDIMEIAFFDTFPDSAGASFDGLWSVYPYFPSGNIIASDRANGLFILTMQ
jgi:choice-of-anchor B domain-containing protein